MNNNLSRPKRPVDIDIELLKRELKSSSKWPASADKLWFHLAQSGPDGGKQGDEIMISLVISDALEGVDISERYPDFYHRMLQNPKLFQTFLEAIEVLEGEYEDTLESVPSLSLSVPQKRPLDGEPIVEPLGPGAWIARWQQGAAQLASIFKNIILMPQPGFRSGWSMLEESSASLIRSKVTIENTNLGVQLTASWADDPDSLNLQLMVALLNEVEETAEFEVSSLVAAINWGAYHQRMAVNEFGKAVFPPMPIAAVTDETGQEINTELKLMLQPID